MSVSNQEFRRFKGARQALMLKGYIRRKINVYFFSTLFMIGTISLLIWSYKPICCFSQEIFKYEARFRRDPFTPLVTSDGRLISLGRSQSDTGLVLEGIIFEDGGISYALINGAVVKRGESIGEYVVLEIRKDEVSLLKDGQIIKIEINKEEE